MVDHLDCTAEKSQARHTHSSYSTPKSLALRFFFNEAFRFDAQPYAHWKHQSAPRISIEVSPEPARHSGVFAARLPAILMAAAFGALFA